MTTTTPYKLSEQQEAVMDWAINDTGHLNLVARAGCGKTSTLLSLVHCLIDNAKGRRQSIFLGAFNKAIASEIKAKLESAGIGWQQAEASTMHAIGFRAWRKVAPNVRIEDNKTRNLINDTPEIAQIAETCGAFLEKLVGHAKKRAFGIISAIDDRSKWFELIEHFGLEEELDSEFAPDLDTLVSMGISLFKRSREQDHTVIDFDDMILAPLAHKARFWQYDWVLIDESQDNNIARTALAMALLKPHTGRLVAVGDPAQAIYGFTGADSDSMNRIKRQMGSKELYLTLTYRCGKEIVSLAQRWVPDIQAHSNNADGLVVSTDVPNFLKVTPAANHAILCRKNAPLVSLAFRYLRRGVACHVEGREIGMGLVSLTNRWKRVTTIGALLDKLSEYKEKEIQRYQAKGQEAKAGALEDKIETIVVLGQKLMDEGKHDVDDLRRFIQGIFTTTPDGQPSQNITLCSIHKSKGREWDVVYLLGRNAYMPSKWARKDWQLQQEDNLCYVAVTRAKSQLIEVHVKEEDGL